MDQIERIIRQQAQQQPQQQTVVTMYTDAQLVALMAVHRPDESPEAAVEACIEILAQSLARFGANPRLLAERAQRIASGQDQLM